MSELSNEKRAVIIALHERGITQSSISQQVGVSQSCVSKTIKRMMETGNTSSKARSGRPRVTTEHGDRLIVRECKKDRFMSVRTIKHRLGLNISFSTINRRLVSGGFSARRPKKKPLLTKAMRSKRLNWAKEYIGKDINFWKTVIFSDETRYNVDSNDSVQFVRRKSHEAYSPNCIVSTVKHPASQMYWGCFSWYGIGRLYVVEGTMNSDQYIQVLENRVMGTVRDMYPNGVASCIYQDDSAPCHRSKKVTEWKRSHGLQSLDWPGNSPDINPIENLWRLIGKELNKVQITSKKNLTTHVIRIWHHEISLQTIQNLIESMPRRVAAVLASGGGTTKY